MEEKNKICNKEGFIVPRDEMTRLVEKLCLDACLRLYDMNIKTVSSNGNVGYAGNLWMSRYRCGFFIHIDYDSLSEQNKEILLDLVKHNIVSITKDDNFGGVKKKVVIIERGRTIKSDPRPVFDEKTFQNKCEIVINSLQPQDVLYGRYTPEVMVKQILLINGITDENARIRFLNDNNLINSDGNFNIKGILDYANTVECPIIIREENGNYLTIYLGQIYDEKTGEFWVNQELLNKHNAYVASLNESEGSRSNI